MVGIDALSIFCILCLYNLVSYSYAGELSLVSTVHHCLPRAINHGGGGGGGLNYRS